VRRQELDRAARVLGIHQQHVEVVDDFMLPVWTRGIR
jgi:hypothetical protein